ncbi:hypothetical protein P9112_004673 [Eukaryota sp. TZLM1-RC]
MTGFDDVDFDSATKPSFDIAIPQKRTSSTLSSSSKPKKKRQRKNNKTQAPPEPKSNPAIPNANPLTPLQQKMQKKLEGARFRQINELLYTSPSSDSLKMFSEEPSLGQIYHRGFAEQVKSWPVNPVNVIIRKLSRLPTTSVVADLGCGEAKIAQSLKCKVHSFDIFPINDHVTKADMCDIPLPDGSVDVVVCCLSLMGTNLLSFFKEASRLLKLNGSFHIAEVSSRFDDVAEFNSALRLLGFASKHKDSSNSHFILLEFRKSRELDESKFEQAKSKLVLNPCIYKRR